MPTLFAYLLKLALCLALGYLFYFVLLRRMTWYQWNRYFLLLFPLFAVVIPVLPLALPARVRAMNASFYIYDSPAVSSNAVIARSSPAATALVSFALVVILAGMALFLLRFVLRLYALCRTCRSASLVSDGGIRLYHIENCAAPFSFGNGIYLDLNRYDAQDREAIIEHERVHIRQNHTLDTIVSELLCVVQWFNPFVWLMKQAARQNLEFIADDLVLRKGTNRKNYQYLLLKVSGAIPYSLANSFSFPSLKKRIQMMNRTRSKRMHLLRFICLLPLGCVLLFSFSGPAKRTTPETDAFSLGNLSFYINDTQVAVLLKKEQANSYLHAGGPLSLVLISEEKARIQALLRKNGYGNLNGHSITFTMDTSATSHSFSVQVTIHLDKDQRSRNHINNQIPPDFSSAEMAARDTQYIVAPDDKQPQLAGSHPPSSGPAPGRDPAAARK